MTWLLILSWFWVLVNLFPVLYVFYMCMYMYIFFSEQTSYHLKMKAKTKVIRKIKFNLLREHGQDVGNSLHGDSWPLAALHSPYPALVQEVAWQRCQGGGSCPVGCHAERDSTVGGLRKVFHVENEGSPEVQRELLIPAKHPCFIPLKQDQLEASFT